MNDLRISFEFEWQKVVGDRCGLYWDDQYEMYTNPDINIAWKWYCRGYSNGERG